MGKEMTTSDSSTTDVHVLPEKDLHDHVESRACWCRPRVERVDGNPKHARLIVHHAADGRELVERHGVN